jgi:hypothetical protein
VLSRVRGSENLVLTLGELGSETGFFGRGAGGDPTRGRRAVRRPVDRRATRRLPAGSARSPTIGRPRRIAAASPHYLRLVVRDKPGIIAALANALARHDLNIDAVLQEGGWPKDALPFVVTLGAGPPRAGRSRHRRESRRSTSTSSARLPADRGLMSVASSSRSIARAGCGCGCRARPRTSARASTRSASRCRSTSSRRGRRRRRRRRAPALRLRRRRSGRRERHRRRRSPTRRAGAALGCPSLDLAVRSTIPVQAGLGSSAAAIVAGLRLVPRLVRRTATCGRLLDAATALEGHPDNVSASILGGLTASSQGPTGVTSVASAWPARVRVVIATPRVGLATSKARGVLPATLLARRRRLQRAADRAAAAGDPHRQPRRDRAPRSTIACTSRIAPPLVPGLGRRPRLPASHRARRLPERRRPVDRRLRARRRRRGRALLHRPLRPPGLACAVRTLDVHQPDAVRAASRPPRPSVRSSA